MPKDTVIDLEKEIKACGWLDRGLYVIADVNYLSNLAHIHTILASGLPPTDDEITDMRVVIRELIDVIMEDNADVDIRKRVMKCNATQCLSHQ